MRLKKFMSVLIVGTMSAVLLAGCGQSTEKETVSTEESETTEDVEKETVELTFMTNVVGEKAEALETAIKGFEEETGYVVEFSAPGDSYEELMKTKMSSNELPDVFTTHGWSVARYSDYLLPINDQGFASRISDQIKPVITNKDGNMFVLPIDIDIAGIVYNADVLEKSGVNVDDLKTWEDFENACAKIKDAGFNPVHMGGKDSWPIGQFFDWVAPSFYVTDETNSKSEELKSGKFDTDTWTEIAKMMDSWTKEGYFNKDCLTADYSSDIEALATDKTAFCFYGNYAIVDAKSVNENANLGMIPIPSNSKNDEPTLIAGESIALGVWKDSAHQKEALELLEYLARPEVASIIAKAAGNASGLTDVEVDLGSIMEYYNKYSDVETFPYFDREYLPSGLWDIMCSTGAFILSETDGAVEDAGKIMEQNFNDKFVQ